MDIKEYFSRKLKILSSGNQIVSETGNPITSKELDKLYFIGGDLLYSLKSPERLDLDSNIENVYQNSLKVLNKNKLFNNILSFCTENGIDSYVVGGPLRDILIGKTPRDLDILIKGDAVKKFDSFAKSRKNIAVTVNPRFATLKVSDGTNVIDIASSRKESYPHNGALPEVEVTEDIITDMSRRDFSINAFALSLSSGKITDPFSGIRDLKIKKITILHPDSFIDDPTRILRAIKFMLRLNFTFSDVTEKSLKKSVLKRSLNTISGFRFVREVISILVEQFPITDVLLLFKRYSVLESYTGKEIIDFEKKLQEIYLGTPSQIKDPVSLFKAIFIFLYAELAESDFIRNEFEKFGFKQKTLKKIKVTGKFNNILKITEGNLIP